MNQKETITIEHIQNLINGLTPKEQVSIIEQEKINYGFSSGAKSNKVYSTGFIQDIETLKNQILADKSIGYKCDWNWFFNAEKIPNQDLVFSTKEFIETERANEYDDSLKFLNILIKQIDLLQENLGKPYDYINSLKGLPLTEEQKHTLFGMLLYWHGGYPVNNLNPQYNTILRLIERHFLTMLPGQDTPEKLFCLSSKERANSYKDIEILVNSDLNNSYGILESRYLSKVNIDFGDLPNFIIKKGIIWNFEGKSFRTDNEYKAWENQYLTFLDTIPQQYIDNLLVKSKEYATKVYQYHLENECSNSKNCILNESWERRIAILDKLLIRLLPQEEDVKAENDESQRVVKNKDFTTARQVLAIHYLIKSNGLNPIDNPTPVARFIQFITGRELNSKRIQDTTIYKKVKEPLKLVDSELIKDLLFIKQFYEQIGLAEIVKQIEEEIHKCEK